MWGATHSYKAQVLRHIPPPSIFNRALATKGEKTQTRRRPLRKEMVRSGQGC